MGEKELVTCLLLHTASTHTKTIALSEMHVHAYTYIPTVHIDDIAVEHVKNTGGVREKAKDPDRPGGSNKRLKRARKVSSVEEMKRKAMSDVCGMLLLYSW